MLHWAALHSISLHCTSTPAILHHLLPTNPGGWGQKCEPGWNSLWTKLNPGKSYFKCWIDQLLSWTFYMYQADIVLYLLAPFSCPRKVCCFKLLVSHSLKDALCLYLKDFSQFPPGSFVCWSWYSCSPQGLLIGPGGVLGKVSGWLSDIVLVSRLCNTVTLHCNYGCHATDTWHVSGLSHLTMDTRTNSGKTPKSLLQIVRHESSYQWLLVRRAGSSENWIRAVNV